jgi:F-type H+-transporting ATPase subunit gamma
MASIKELRIRIKSLKNTNKITAAMKLVATSKLKKSQDAMKANKPYSDKLDEVLGRISNSSDLTNPLLEVREVKKVRIYAFTSDKGLCGSFNNGLIKYARNTLPQQFKGKDIEVLTLGKRAKDFFSKNTEYFTHDFEGITKSPNFADIAPIAEQCIQDFLEGKIDEVHLLFNEFESVLVQNPMTKLILPIEANNIESEEGTTSFDYIYEPDGKALLDTILPNYVAIQFFQGLLENAAGEHGARMNAMENATKNSKELINDLTLVMNRARQAQITTELTEIVSGAESLKG